MSNRPLTVEIHSDHALVRIPDSPLAKPVSIKDLLTTLCSSAENVFSFGRTEKVRLPPNTYLTEYAGQVLNLVMYFPETPKTLKFNTGTCVNSYDVMMPNIVIHLALRVHNGGARHEVIGVYYYSTQVPLNDLPSTIPGPMRRVFGHVPLPNFYDNHTMCMGRNQPLYSLDGGDLRAFRTFYDVLTDSPFNSDLYLRNVLFDYEGDYRKWFAELQRVFKEDNRFPYEHVRI